MVFKLVRIDTQEPCKIQLTIGKHVIGRGKFLHNDDTDKRVSRNHAELEVTPDTVNLKSLHQNPCFFIKKSIETQLLHKDSMVYLCHGDKFGLMPNHFWYEVLHCPDQYNAEERTTTSETTDNGVQNDEKDRIDHTEQVRDNVTPDSAAIEEVNEEEAINFEDGEEGVDPIRSASPSLLTAVHVTVPETTDQATSKLQTTDQVISELKTTDHIISEPKTADQVTSEPKAADQANSKPEIVGHVTSEPETADQVTIKQESDSQETIHDQDTENYDPPPQVSRPDDVRSPVKRDHSSTESSPVDVKKVKIEHADAENAVAGPSNSNGQQAAPDTGNKDSIAASLSTTKQPPRPRERCIYGANCYRRNPQHKTHYSHPSDADWGDGDRGVCPYGANCRRHDPRHWQGHSHPPGTLPPYERGLRPGKRQKRRQRRQRRDSVSDDDEVSSAGNLIVTGKRARKPVQRQGWSDEETDEEQDPYGTDESDEWQPSSDVTTSQDFSQDL